MRLPVAGFGEDHAHAQIRQVDRTGVLHQTQSWSHSNRARPGVDNPDVGPFEIMHVACRQHELICRCDSRNRAIRKADAVAGQTGARVDSRKCLGSFFIERKNSTFEERHHLIHQRSIEFVASAASRHGLDAREQLCQVHCRQVERLGLLRIEPIDHGTLGFRPQGF